MRPPRLPIALIISLAALLAAAGLVSVSADEEADQAETFVTRLEPGDNLIGWTAHVAPVESLFEQLPQIQHVWAWDASWRRWRLASPNMPSRMWTLNVLTPGMGLRIRLGGNQSVNWERPRRPAQGTVKLKPGWNLVAWMGRDEAPLHRVALGIGKSLLHMGSWTAETQTLLIHDEGTIASAGAHEEVEFGRAVWANVERSVNWLQPTGMLPVIRYAVSASKILQETIQTDLRDAIDYYWQHFGIEADFSTYKMIVPDSYRTYFEMLDLEAPNNDGDWNEIAPALYVTYGNTAAYLMVKQELWSGRDDYMLSGRSSLMHEYTHAMEDHLDGIPSNSAQSRRSTPSWMIEGFAMFVEDLQQHADGEYSWERTEASAWERTLVAPALNDSSGNGAYRYILGRAAMYLLVDEPTTSRLIEFYRLSSPRGTGPGFRWETRQTWEDTFLETFGIDSAEAYKRFAAQRPGSGSLEIRGEFDRHHNYGPDTQTIIGSVTSADTVEQLSWKVYAFCRPAAGGSITTSRVHGGIDDGGFELAVPAESTCVLRVEFGSIGCAGYYDDGRLVAVSEDAELILAQEATVLRLKLDETDCPERVSGRLLTRDGLPLSGIAVTLYDRDLPFGVDAVDRRPYLTVLTSSDGSFGFAAPGETSRTMEIGLTQTGCSPIVQDDGSIVDTIPIHRTGGQTPWGVQVALDRASLDVFVPESTCAFGLRGKVVDSAGNPQIGAEVRIEGEGAFVPVTIDRRGHFEVSLSRGGLYQVTVSTGQLGREGCSVLYRRSAQFGSEVQGSGVSIGAGDFPWLSIKMPEICRKIVGRITGELGNGDSELIVNAYREDGVWAAGAAEKDGAFVVAIPDLGAYRLSVDVDGCTVYYQSNGATISRDEATLISVEDDDVRGLRFTLPSGVCSTKINGRVLDANGGGLGNVWVNAQSEDAIAGAQTQADGSFEITMRESGSYLVTAQINGCLVYYRRGGATGSYQQRTQIQVFDSEVTVIQVQLAEGMCERRMSGKLFKFDGTPRSGQWVRASGVGGNGGATTDSTGTFSFAVPTSGSYRVSVRIDGCSIYRGSQGSTTDWNSASEVTVSNADVTGIEFRLPENPSTFCN